MKQGLPNVPTWQEYLVKVNKKKEKEKKITNYQCIYGLGGEDVCLCVFFKKKQGGVTNYMTT